MNDSNWPWAALALSAATQDVNVIKRAYAKLLKGNRPDDDGAAYQNLRAAYEAALALASDKDAVQPASSGHSPVVAESSDGRDASSQGSSSEQHPAGQEDSIIAEAIEVVQDFLSHPPSALRTNAVREYWVRLHQALDTLPLHAKSEASIRCAKLVMNRRSIPSLIALELDAYFGWTNDFKLSKEIGVEDASLLLGWLGEHKRRHASSEEGSALDTVELNIENLLERAASSSRAQAPKPFDPEAAKGKRQTTASHPGLVALSTERLRRLQPELFGTHYEWDIFVRRYWGNYQGIADINWKTRIQDHLLDGDSTAALVIDAQKAVVAVYSVDMDCVVLLQFAPAVAAEHGWQVGTRLLSVNMYSHSRFGVAKDLIPGPAWSRVWGNFHPLIANILSDDQTRIQQRTNELSERVWARTQECVEKALKARIQPRDGRPLLAFLPNSK